MRRSALLIILVQSLFLASTAAAEVIVYDNEADWLAATENVEYFMTSSSNLGKANELSRPPEGNSDMGSFLTFEAAKTGLSRSFTLRNLNVPPSMERGLVYDDSEAGLAGPRNISIGDADGIGNPKTRSLYENDDWRVGVFSGPKLTAFAFTIVGNNESIDESLSFFAGGILVGVVTDLATENGPRFIGVTSDAAITRILFDEDEFDPGPDFDDIAIRDFRFGQKSLQPTPIEQMNWAGIKALFR